MREPDDLGWTRGLPTLYRRSDEWGEGEVFLHSENICPTGKIIPTEFVVFGPCSWAEPCQWCRERSPWKFVGRGCYIKKDVGDYPSSSVAALFSFA